jgi:hypothetical protein
LNWDSDPNLTKRWFSVPHIAEPFNWKKSFSRTLSACLWITGTAPNNMGQFMSGKTSTSVLESLRASIETAHFGEFDRLGQSIWAAHGARQLSDDEASWLAATLQASRTSNRPPPTVGAALRTNKLTFKRAPYQRSPNRAASVGRRRLLAASGPMPPALAQNYTTCELAVLKILADEVSAKGYCALDIAQIAARAGVCKSTVRNATRAAEMDCLIKVLRRPRPGLKHLTNIITIIRAEWKQWVASRPRRRVSSGNAAPLIPTGCKSVESTASDLLKKDRIGVWRPKGIGNRTGAGRA